MLKASLSKSFVNNSTPLGLPLLLFTLLGIYTIQSMVGMFAFQGVPAILRAEGISTTTIGVLYLIMLPWALKFLWAPKVERYRQSSQSFTPYIKLTFIGNTLLALIFIMLTFISLKVSFLWVFAILMLMALIPTVVDIAGDGFAVEQLSHKNHSLGNIMQVGGSYLGALIGGGLFIYWVANYNWHIALYLLAAITFLMAILVIPLKNTSPKKQDNSEPVLPSIKRAWQNSSIRKTLFFVALSQAGTRLVLAMMMPFFIDQGLALADLGLLAAGGGAPAGIVGVLIGGFLSRHFGTEKMLTVMLWLEIVCFIFFLFFFWDLFPDSLEEITLMSLFVISSMVFSAKFVVLYTLMMHRSTGDQPGVNFTLFQSVDSAVAIITAMIGGWVITQWSYTAHFSVAIVLTVFSLLVITFSKPFLTKR